MTAPSVAFERDTGGTDVEWRRWLLGACGGHELRWTAPGEARVAIAGGGELQLDWHALPPRRIALICLPRLLVRYRFIDTPEAARQAFMRYFDLYMQRGGG